MDNKAVEKLESTKEALKKIIKLVESVDSKQESIDQVLYLDEIKYYSVLLKEICDTKLMHIQLNKVIK